MGSTEEMVQNAIWINMGLTQKVVQNGNGIDMGLTQKSVNYGLSKLNQKGAHCFLNVRLPLAKMHVHTKFEVLFADQYAENGFKLNVPGHNQNARHTKPCHTMPALPSCEARQARTRASGEGPIGGNHSLTADWQKKILRGEFANIVV